MVMASGPREIPGRYALEPNSAPAARAELSLADQLDTGTLERIDQFHHRVQIAPDLAVTALHPLNGRQRQARSLGQTALVEPQQGPCGSNLGGCNHIYDMDTCVLHIIMQLETSQVKSDTSLLPRAAFPRRGSAKNGTNRVRRDGAEQGRRRPETVRAILLLGNARASGRQGIPTSGIRRMPVPPPSLDLCDEIQSAHGSTTPPPQRTKAPAWHRPQMPPAPPRCVATGCTSPPARRGRGHRSSGARCPGPR